MIVPKLFLKSNLKEANYYILFKFINNKIK